MRACCALTVAVVAATVLVASSAAQSADTASNPFTLSEAVSSDLVSSIASTQDSKHDRRLLRSYADEEDDGDYEHSTEERVDTGFTSNMKAEMEAIKLRMVYKDWLLGGKTAKDVRLIMGLPAEGEAVSHQNWVAFLNYVKYVKQEEEFTAKLAEVAAIKVKLGLYKDWFFRKKSSEQVRGILGLPAKGDAASNPNWVVFQNYLKFREEFSKHF